MKRIVLVIIAILVLALAPTAGNSVVARSAPARTDSLVAAVDFVSPTTGWVVLYSPRISHAGGGCRYDLTRVPVTVLKTVDAGRHWSAQLHFTGTSSVFVRGQLPGMWMHFMNARDGFISGPSTSARSLLYRTRDGGTTWRALVLPGVPGGFFGDPFSFTSAHNGWLLADVGAAMGQSSANVFHTIDGGSHWVRVAYSRIVGRPGNLSAGGDKNAIVFRSATVGWITAPSSAGPGIVARTSDGGMHWAGQVLTLPRHGMSPDTLGSNGDPSPPVIFTRSSGLLTTDVYVERTSSPRTVPANGAPHQVYIYSLNRDGLHWGNPHVLPGTDNLDHPMYWQLLDPQRWWVGAGNTLRRTINAGRTWRTSQLKLPKGYRMTHLDFVGSNRGWALAAAIAGAFPGDPPCASILLHTNDAGVRWTPITAGG